MTVIAAGHILPSSIMSRPLRHIRVLICQVGDDTPDLVNELACFDLATPDVASLQPETALDALEALSR